MKSLSIRRHHYLRRKMFVKKQWKSLGRNIDFDPIIVGKYANTRQPCSCYMCGNPRKYLGEKTIQEKKFDYYFDIDG